MQDVDGFEDLGDPRRIGSGSASREVLGRALRLLSWEFVVRNEQDEDGVDAAAVRVCQFPLLDLEAGIGCIFLPESECNPSVGSGPSEQSFEER